MLFLSLCFKYNIIYIGDFHNFDSISAIFNGASLFISSCFVFSLSMSSLSSSCFIDSVSSFSFLSILGCSSKQKLKASNSIGGGEHGGDAVSSRFGEFPSTETSSTQTCSILSVALLHNCSPFDHPNQRPSFHGLTTKPRDITYVGRPATSWYSYVRLFSRSVLFIALLTTQIKTL